MSEKRACPECGTTLPPDAPRGLCPRCLMGAAFSATATHRPTGEPEAAAPSSPAAAQVDLAVFRHALAEVGLVDPRELERIAAAEPGGALGLARALVRAGKLTPYQAGAVLQGKARGLTIGGYLVLEKLGVGGMGVVFKARDRRDGRTVALKILPPSFGREREAVHRFRREFEIASRLNHPNVVAAIEAAEDRGVQFLTMDYIKGHNLEDLVSDGGSLPIKLALHCTIQAARGLEAAHAQRVIHRDIKPANIMLDDAGGVRVLDLGLARVIEATSSLGRSMHGTLTHSGAYMGTVDFLAPEQADDAKRADHRADIYSLGCTLYFLLTGRPPFGGDTLLKRLMAHQERPAPSLQAARPEVSDALEAIYQKMMAKRPADRPQSMTEVVEALEACRTSAREAGDASADLKTFARTVLKRAAPRGRFRDTSIFARDTGPTGDDIDPNLRLEDLMGDYREEAPPEEIAEEKLPPIQPRLAPRPRKRRRRQPVPPFALAALLVLVLAGAAYLLRPAPDPGPAARDTLEPITTATTPVVGFVRLFNGKDLSGWTARNSTEGDWTVEDGAIQVRGRGIAHMSLYTDRAYSDFLLKLEYKVSPDSNSGLLLGDFSREGKPPQYLEFNVSGSDIKQWKPGDFFIVRGSAENAIPVPVQSVERKPDGEWNALELESKDGTLTCSINGRRLEYPRKIYMNEPRQIGFQGFHGVTSYRNIEIEERKPSAPAPKYKPFPYVDTFDDPESGWPNETAEQLARDAGFHASYINGLHRLDLNEKGWRFPPGAATTPEAFTCEVEGRVYGDKPGSRGNLSIGISFGRPGMQVGVWDNGQVAVLFTGQDGGATMRYGPFFHPSVKTGPKDFNRITVHVSKGRALVLVNGNRMCDPIEIPHEGPPRGISLGIACSEPNIRVEYDRIAIREIDTATAASIATAPVAKPGPPGPKLGNTIYEDDFSNPETGWRRDDTDMGPGLNPFLRDYDVEKGLYFLEAPESWLGAEAWDCTGPLAGDFQVNLSGRVFGAGDSPGGWGVIIPGPDEGRGFQVGIDRESKLAIDPAFWALEKYPNDPHYLPPTAHPAIKPATEWNLMAVRVRKRQLEVFVNGVPMGNPIKIDWDVLPARPQIAIYKPHQNTRVRAEFDRVEILEVLGP